MNWTRQDTLSAAFAWLAVIVVVVVVCVLLPTPPPPDDPGFVSVLLDFFFGAVIISLASGIAAVFCAFRFVQRLSREIADREQEMLRQLRGGGRL